MKRFLFYKILLWSGLTLLLSFFIFTAVVQSPWGKEAIKNHLIVLGKRANAEFSISKIETVSPRHYIVNDVEFAISQNQKMVIKSLEVDISILPLLRKMIYINKLLATDLFITPIEQKATVASAKRVKLPFSIHLSSFQVKNLHLEKFTFNADGKIKINRAMDHLFLDANVYNDKFKKAKLHIVSKTYKKGLLTKIDLKTPTLKAFLPKFDFDADLSIAITVEGSLNAFFDKVSNEALSGTAKGTIIKIKKGIPKQLRRGFNFSSDFSLKNYSSLQLSNAKIIGTDFRIYGKASFSRDKKSAFLTFTTLSSFLPSPIKGALNGEIALDFPNISLNVKSNSLIIDELALDKFSASITSTFNEEKAGKLKGSFESFSKPFIFSANYTLNDTLSLSDAVIKGENSSITFNLDNISKENSIGRIALKTTNPQELKAFLPVLLKDLKASQISLDAEINKQNIKLDADLTALRLNNFFGESLKFSVSAENLFQEPKVALSLNLKKALYKNIAIDQASIESSNFLENWPFTISILGNWKKPMKVNASGFWKIKEREVLLNLQNFEGYLMNYPFSIPSPVEIALSKDKLIVKDLEVNMDMSNIKTTLLLSKNEADIRFAMEHMPLDFLSLNPFNLDFSGFASIYGNVVKKEKQLNGDININVEKLNVTSLGDKEPFKTNGNFHILIKDQLFDMQGYAKDNGEEIMALKILLPMQINFMPFYVVIDANRELKASLSFNGRIEKLLDYVQIGSHHLEGNLDCRFDISQTLNNPSIKGSASFLNGFYENYYTGTRLTNISAKLSGSNQTLYLENLSANDREKGSFQAVGEATLNIKDSLPFKASIDFSNFLCAQKDWLEAYASGKATIKGNLKQAEAEGVASIIKADLSIPSVLPIAIPDLTIVYLDGKKKKRALDYTPISIYPIKLNFLLTAPNQIFINGRGLKSEWKGSLKVEGTYLDILASGSLELLKGNFSFMDHNFILSEGSNVTFTGKKNELPSLNILGKMKVKDTTLIAHLLGPLNSPKLIFKSAPPLPVSSIMSLLLFGQDISMLSGIQAAELSAIISTLSNGPVILEKTRKNLGIDRTSIITTPEKNTDDLDEMASQVGKYITQGITVSVSQGTDEGSTNGIIEVDLTNGFAIQAETQQEEEQGKFTLKWFHNY